MIIVDTSVWVDHFRRGDALLTDLLNRNRVLSHPFVIGELALGNLNPQSDVLSLLAALPIASVASESEVLLIISARGLAGRGIGLVDAHLVASALLDSAKIYTKDKRLAETAKRLKLTYTPR